jgi:uncharacterized protein (TIGR01777 family)
MRVLITGGSGLIGRTTTNLLASAGHEVVVLSRKPERVTGLPHGARAQAWDAQSGEGWFDLVNANTVIVNLAGHSLFAWRWTKQHKKNVVESRLAAARAVVDGIRRSRRTPRLVIQASAVGYYGDRGDDELTELSPPGEGFLAETCKQWEKAIPVAVPGRRVFARFGVVLSRAGGAFPKLLLNSRLGVGKLASGQQWFPWVHEDDVASAIRFLMLNDIISGPFNIVAPEAVTAREFLRVLAKVRRKPAPLPVPKFALKLGMGEMSHMLLDSQRVVPRKLLDNGFEFRYDSVEDALRALMA